MTDTSEEKLLQKIANLKEKLAAIEEKDVLQQLKIADLKEDLLRYEMAANGANDGLWDWDLINNTAFFSKPWKSMLGYEDHELKNELATWENLLHPEDLEKATTSFKEYIEGISAVYAVEFRLRHKEGSYRWIFSKGKVIRDELGNAIRVSGSHTDITDRKIAEAALINSERKFRNLFENSLVGIVRTNQQGVVLEANKTAYKIFDVAPSQNINAVDFYADPFQRDQLFRELYEKGVVEIREMLFKKMNGDLFWGSFSAVLYKEENFSEAVIIDITETKENLLKLQKVNLELDNFVYHASHDLRSPLRSILGLVSILRMGKISKEQKNCLEMIEGSINRMDKLVLDLLSISRNSRINDPYVFINFLVEINNSITNFYHASVNKNLHISTKVFQPVDFIGDLTRIRIILNNLISNAIKYRSYKREISYIEIAVHVNEKEALFVIEDNGEGIPEASLSSIFDMFVRASETGEGSGLGLYIVKDAIEKLDGKIEVKSEIDIGTKFQLSIPNGTPENKKRLT